MEVDKKGCACAQCGCVYIPRRFIIVIMTCLGMIISHAQRVNVAVTVVTITSEVYYGDNVTMATGSEQIRAHPWSSQMVGFLHCVFYIGYIGTQIPGGYLAQCVPSIRLFGGCILVSCLLNLLIPVTVEEVGFILLCILRGAQGLSEGLLYPSTYAILSHWTTPRERSRMGAIVLTGIYIGPVIGLVASGWLCHVYGWPSVFYVHGIAGVIWFLFWLFFAYESPSTHPSINNDEKDQIQKQQGLHTIVYENDSVPWRSIVTSMPVMAINVCNFARSFIFFFLLTNEPAFFNIFGYTIAENGIISSLPHLLMAVMAAISGPIADALIASPILTRTRVRKMFTCLGFGTEALCLFCLGFARNGTSALIFLSIGVGVSGLTISGWQINHLDLAPRYASVLVGMSTAVGTLAGITNPLIVGWLTEENTIESWHHVFFLISSVLAVSVIFYLLFGSGDTQLWANPYSEEQVIVKTDDCKNPDMYGTFNPQPHVSCKEDLVKEESVK